MDGTRTEDLKLIDQHIKSATTLKDKRELEESRNKILRDSKNRKLVDLRRRLVNASRYGKGEDARKIHEEIRAYERSL